MTLVSVWAEILVGFGAGVGFSIAALVVVSVVVGDPHMIRDMWECRARPIKRLRDRRSRLRGR
ncbi:hypothetical protein CH275_15900 [Rhodococcus sp. 06-235-1A]|uniref:hypothetical protein n=1 Tax=Rhodococcus sp. 06-235-1A TaxID=2022508 RepID=UPI000B9BB1FD|nr:hypothetical protein [Rhodococcus sp. 06-235-1A]OZD03873.1 hypothetical protein CH275_15900 [Rhodococcus sp. 06-235-1A]